MRAMPWVKLSFEIFSYPRHDERMRVHRNHLRERSHVCPCAQVDRQERRAWILLLDVFDDRERLHQGRAVAVEQGGHRHLRIERRIGVLKLLALEQVERNGFCDQSFKP